MLKKISDLEDLKKQVRASLAARQSAGAAQFIVAMGTCGIAAGAREVVTSILEEVEKRQLGDVTITQSGCKGLCDREPMLTVVKPGEAPVTYGDIDADAARRIINEHIIGGKVVEEFVVFTGEAEEAKE